MTIETNTPAKKRISGMKVWPYVFSAPFVIAYLLFSLFPTIYSFYISLFKWSGIGAKEYVGFKNYITLFTKDPLFYKSLYNTIVIMLMAKPTQLICGLLLAQFVFNLTKGRRFFQTVAFLPYITAPVAIGFIFAYIFDWHHGYANLILTNLGILKEGIYWIQTPSLSKLIVSLMIVWKLSGYSMIIYIAGMTAIPTEMYEAAKVDGANAVTTFFRITLPQLKNITIFLVVTSLISGLQIFDEPVMLYGGNGLGTSSVGGPEYSALTVIWKFYDNTFKTNMALGYGAAISYALFVIIVLLSMLSYKISNRRSEE